MTRRQNGTFKKGVSGNPGGRPAGLVRKVREATSDGADIVDYITSVLNDTEAVHKHRFEAARWLTERGWGRATDSAEPVRYSNQMDELLEIGPFDY